MQDQWQWSDGRPWDYKQWLPPVYDQVKNESGTDSDCMFNQNFVWANIICDASGLVICENSPTKMSGSQKLVFKNTSLIDPTFHFWWNYTFDRSANKVPGFKID